MNEPLMTPFGTDGGLETPFETDGEQDESNPDLIGYETEFAGDPPSRWRVTKGDGGASGQNYVTLTRVLPDGTLGTDPTFDIRIQNAGVVRRRKQIEEVGA